MKKIFKGFILPTLLLITALTTFITHQDLTLSNTGNAFNQVNDYFSSQGFEHQLIQFSYYYQYIDQMNPELSTDENLKAIFGANLDEQDCDDLKYYLIDSVSLIQTNQFPFLSIQRFTAKPDFPTNSRYVWAIYYDQDGNIQLLDGYNDLGFPIKSVYNSFLNDYFNGEKTLRSLNTPKNCYFQFSIDQNTSDQTIMNNLGIYGYEYNNSKGDYVLFTFIVLFVYALVVPLDKVKTSKFYEKIFQVPLELSVFFSFMAFTITASTILYDPFYENIMAVLSYCLLAFIFVGDVYIMKYFFSMPIKEYFKNHTYSYQIYKFIKKEVLAIDLSNKNYLGIIFLLTVNLFCTIFFYCFFNSFFGILLYQFILFFVICIYMDKIKKDYDHLLNMTSAIASGKWDQSQDMNLGFFNSYKESMDTIRDDFKQAVDNELKSERFKAELITSVSHDLKTPLTSIVSYVDLLNQPNTSDEQKEEYIQIIERNALRLKNLINDLVEVNKATSGNLPLEYSELDLVSLFKQVLVEYENSFSKQGLQIKFNSSHEKIKINLDGQKTYRIFTNLMNNIAKYALENTRVYIDLIQNEDNVNITFKNISKNEIQVQSQDLFERFVQGDRSRHSEGSGLGLAIVKTFTEMQHGTCDLNVDGDLFKVTLTFPITNSNII